MPPGLATLVHYKRGDLRYDLIAGATVTALLIPAGLAQGAVAGVTPVAGLYTGVFAMIVYAFLGSSRTLVVGPESQMAILVAAALLPFAASGAEYAALASAMALITAAVCLAAWVLRLGFMAEYLSQPVLVGYLTGVALIIIVNQVAKLIGTSASGDTLLDQAFSLWANRADIDTLSIAVGAVSLAIIFALRRISPKVPAALVAVVVMTAASGMIGLADQGVEVVGEVPRGLPLPQLPSIGFDEIGPLIGPAAGLALIVFANSVLTGRAYAERSKSDPVDPNAELLALSGSNAAAGLFTGFAIGASDSRTAVNYSTGGRTQLSGLLAAGFTALFLLALAPLVTYLPAPTLGAIVIVAAISIVRPKDWAALYRFRRFEVTLGVVTLVGVAVLGILPGIILAVIVNLLELVSTLSHPKVAALGPVEGSSRWRAVSPRRAAELVPDVLAIRYDGPLFFASADYLVKQIEPMVYRRRGQITALVLNLEAVNHVDLNGAKALASLVRKIEGQGITVALARVRRDVARSLYRGGVMDVIGDDHVYDRVEDAVSDLSSLPRHPLDMAAALGGAVGEESASGATDDEVTVTDPVANGDAGQTGASGETDAAGGTGGPGGTDRAGDRDDEGDGH